MSPHPAESSIYVLLNAIKEKNFDSFKNCFDVGLPFEDILPGGKIVSSAKELIEGHVDFFASEHSAFSFTKLQSPFEDENSYSATTMATVTRPDKKTVKMYIRILFCRNHQRWLPRFFQNTVINEEEHVI